MLNLMLLQCSFIEGSLLARLTIGHIHGGEVNTRALSSLSHTLSHLNAMRFVDQVSLTSSFCIGRPNCSIDFIYVQVESPIVGFFSSSITSVIMEVFLGALRAIECPLWRCLLALEHLQGVTAELSVLHVALHDAFLT